MKELIQIVAALLLFSFIGVALLFAVALGRRAYGDDRDQDPPTPPPAH